MLDLYSDVKELAGGEVYMRDCSERSYFTGVVNGGEGLGWRKACKWLRVAVKIKVGRW